MAEFLIYIRAGNKKGPGNGHWLDDAEEEVKMRGKFSHEVAEQKFNARPRPGDIIETRPDGYWGEPDDRSKHGWDHGVFALLKLPGISAEQVKQYMESDMDVTGSGDDVVVTMVTRCQYSFATLNLQRGETRIIDGEQIYSLELANTLIDKKRDR